MHRFVKIDGVHNFRDFGGYRSRFGGQITKMKLFRSGQFNDMTLEGQKRLSELGPKIVVDLRKSNERATQPSNFSLINPIIIENDLLAIEEYELPAHLEFLRIARRTYDEVENYMVDLSAKIAFEDDHKTIFAKAIQTIADENQTVIIHCTAGKDRTGTLCALILKALGVHDDDVLEDYLLTNKTPKLDNIIEYYAQKVAPKIGYEIDPKIIAPMGMVSEKYFRALMSGIEANFGGVEKYLNAIGIDNVKIAQLRKNFLE